MEGNISWWLQVTVKCIKYLFYIFYKGQIEGKTTLRQYLQIVQQRQPGISITPVVFGLEKYFR